LVKKPSGPSPLKLCAVPGVAIATVREQMQNNHFNQSGRIDAGQF
jgi:hypothetical protein